MPGGHEDDSPEQRHRDLITTTMPVLRPDSVLSHVSAGIVWGLPVPWRLLGRVHITRSSGSGKTSRWVHRHLAPLEDADCAVLDGLAVTGLVRTALDLSCLVHADEALAVMDACLRLGATPDELAAKADQITGLRGVGQARFAARHANALSESVGESRSRYWMIACDLELPELQVEIHDADGALVARSDFGWLERGVLGEFDGRVKYQSVLLRAGETASDAVMREKRRENRLRQMGYWVIRWVNDDLKDGYAFARRLERELALGGRTSGRTWIA